MGGNPLDALQQADLSQMAGQGQQTEQREFTPEEQAVLRCQGGEKGLQQGKMAGAGDGQKFRRPLDQAEDHSKPECHTASRNLYDIINGDPWQGKDYVYRMTGPAHPSPSMRRWR